MPILDNPRHETFAQTMAQGGTARMAGHAAGYRDTRCQRRAKREDISARVEELTFNAKWGGDEELADVFAMLVVQADKAESIDSAAAKIAIWRLLAEAARVRLAALARRPVPNIPPAAPAPFNALPPSLTKEEWLAAFAPKP